ncbi:MAG: UMP kinase [Opitutales bacterium]
MTENPNLKYCRVVLKFSGEVLGNRQSGEPIDAEVLLKVCREIKAVHELGAEVAVVVGGGNIFRGLKGIARGVDRTTGDHMGMLATVINGLAIMDCLEQMGVDVRVQSALEMNRVCEPFILRRAQRHLEKGRILVFVAGTGNPYFSTDSTAALRASEIKADVILKATKVDGVYTADPVLDPEATKYETLTFTEAMNRNIGVMDGTAFALCRDNNIPILVFKMDTPGAIESALKGETIGTLVHA